MDLIDGIETVPHKSRTYKANVQVEFSDGESGEESGDEVASYVDKLLYGTQAPTQVVNAFTDSATQVVEESGQESGQVGLQSGMASQNQEEPQLQDTQTQDAQRTQKVSSFAGSEDFEVEDCQKVQETQKVSSFAGFEDHDVEDRQKVQETQKVSSFAGSGHFGNEDRQSIVRSEENQASQDGPSQHIARDASAPSLVVQDEDSHMDEPLLNEEERSERIKQLVEQKRREREARKVTEVNNEEVDEPVKEKKRHNKKSEQETLRKTAELAKRAIHLDRVVRVDDKFSTDNFLQEFEAEPPAPTITAPVELVEEKSSEPYAPLESYKKRVDEEASASRTVMLDQSSSDEEEFFENIKGHTSKDRQLEIRAKFSKKPVKKDDFFKTLKKMTVAQLQDLQRGRGNNEELDLENEQVEDLLEQEIERSKRIREREKQKEKKEVMESDYESLNESMDESGSASEGEQDQDEKDGDSNDFSKDQNDEKDASLVSYGNTSFMNTQDIKMKLVGDLGIESQDLLAASYKETQPPLSMTIPHSLRLLETQNMVLDTQADGTDSDSDEEKIKPQRVKKSTQHPTRESPQEVPQEASQADLDNMYAIEVRLAQEKQRAKDLRARQRQREMKRVGVNNILDQEAEESEDEWKGLGGVDGEVSDAANSEDEQMMDDKTRFDLDENALRELLAKDDHVKDEALVRRLLEDLKNGKLRRRRGFGVDLDLSDDDEEISSFYRERLRRQRANLLNDSNLAKLAQNEKSKAFFESIAEKGSNFKLDEEEEEDKGEQESEPKKRKLTEEYVQKTLSYLYEDEDDSRKQIESEQHGIDLDTLKRESSIKVCPRAKMAATHNEEDAFDSILGSRNSSLNSFRSEINKKTVTSRVQISTRTKAITDSRASITYKAAHRTLRVQNKPTQDMPKSSFLSTISGSFDQ